MVTKLLLNMQSWGKLGPGPQGDKFEKRLILTKIHVFLRLAKEARQGLATRIQAHTTLMFRPLWTVPTASLYRSY